MKVNRVNQKRARITCAESLEQLLDVQSIAAMEGLEDENQALAKAESYAQDDLKDVLAQDVADAIVDNRLMFSKQPEVAYAEFLALIQQDEVKQTIIYRLAKALSLRDNAKSYIEGGTEGDDELKGMIAYDEACRRADSLENQANAIREQLPVLESYWRTKHPGIKLSKDFTD